MNTAQDRAASRQLQKGLHRQAGEEAEDASTFPVHGEIQKEVKVQGRGWDREDTLSDGETIKMGMSQRREQSVKGCALSKCSRQVEFQTVSEQKLERKIDSERVGARKARPAQCEQGRAWKLSKERRKDEVKTSQLERRSRSKEKAWQMTDAGITLPEASDTNQGLSK